MFLFSLFFVNAIISTVFSAPITVVNKDGINQWWYACYIEDVEGAAEVTKVSIRDSSSGATYFDGTPTTYGAWAFQSGTAYGWVLPFDIRITNSDNAEIESNNLITNFNYFEEYDFGNNFNPNSNAPAPNTNIEIINKDGINHYWHAFFVTNRNNNSGSLTNVEIRDSSQGSNWVTGYSEEGEFGTFYAFQNNNGWILPFDIRLTNCNNDILTGYNIIPNRIELGIFDFGDNFEDSTCPTPAPVTPSSNIILTKFQGYNQWWVALEIDGVTPGTTITSVELRDSGINPSGIWNLGVYHDWGDVKPWTFDVTAQGRPFVLSFDIRITDSSGTVLLSNGVVDDWADGATFDFGSNF